MTKTYPIEFSKEEDIIYIGLDVADFDRAKKFYREIFNFEITFDAGKDIGWCELELPVKGIKLGLSSNDNKKIKQGSTTMGINVEDIEKTKKYLESKEVYTTDIRDLPDLVSLFDMKDSEGNLIQILGKPRITSKK
ncbi:VOC family protein [Promethearchaeum syntrophicum]|uniref:VOC family protein n=1 Tax=Promethearchaeum syntrophicum TaxID=2594042 RepID=A0A5B9DDX0_9ARCH|nr:VOC family protein [Candidatus Prometheoarchaeum syntrophicum]QEE17077.1 Glyoxalase-like domain protein [Candidatus Prometheoarchaeum syntrophicum]